MTGICRPVSKEAVRSPSAAAHPPSPQGGGSGSIGRGLNSMSAARLPPKSATTKIRCLRASLREPENIENTPIDELFEIIKDKSHNRLTKAKAISIKEAAADTFGIKIAQDAFSFQLKQLIDRMNFLDKQIEALDIEIMKYYEQFDCYLHTIPGIGIIGAATILAEIGDISRFKNSSALVAFAGIDPTVRQSGEFNSTHNHMSKRGSPYLRHAIFLAATTCSFHNSPLNAYYKKKRDQGKHHLTATGAVARKLTTIIYAVLRDSKPYEPKKFC